MTAQPFLIPPPPPEPPEPKEPPEEAPRGTLRGDIAGLEAAAARVEVYCGRERGWVPFGARVGSSVTLCHVDGRMRAGPHFDLGPSRLTRPKAEA